MRITGTILLLSLSCATTEYKVEEVDTEMNVTSKGLHHDIGVNEEGQAIIQENQDARTALKVQEAANSRLEHELGSEAHELTSCREALADPRLGGNGKVTALPDIDDLKETTEVREEIGLDGDGNLRVVSKQYFVERIQKEKQYTKRLKDMLRVLKKHRIECERKLKFARIKAKMQNTESEAADDVENHTEAY